MTNQKELMTWSLRIQDADYRHDYEQYGHKIRSIGLHEWDVDGAGNIAIYRLGPVKGTDGIYTSFTNATTYDRYASGRQLFPVYVEPDMKRWPHIEYYMQMVIFGPETVSKILDSQTVQTNFINNLKQVVSLFRKDQNGVDLGYTGIEIDCEGSWSDDKWDVRVGDDEKMIAFLKRIKNEVIIDSNPDFKFRINAHAMWGAGTPDYYRFHNYKLFAESTDKLGRPLMDEVQVMTYDFSWSGSAPGPSTPLWWMENVAKWVQECFDPAFNPKAKCTIDKVYLGGAGYGRRWPIYSEDTWGSSVTYRNLVDWQNGYYIHHQGGGIMADQDFIPMNAFNDPNSDNQIMYNHQYDYFKAKHMQKPTSMGQITARTSVYNGIEYATAYSKNQHMKVTGLRGVTGLAGISEPSNNISTYESPKRSETAVLDIGGQSYTFQGYQTRRVPYVPTKLADGSVVCQKSTQPETVLTYTVNVAQAGTYRIGAVVSFPFYGQTKLNGAVNGSGFTIGGDAIPDYYPLMFKGVHVWDIGSISLNAGANTITINGLGSQHGTIIFGFIVADQIDLEVIGGEMSASPNIQQYKKRDGSPAKLPNQLAFTNEVLQQAPRPVIMWEDFFRQFLEDVQVQTYGLQSTTYYRLTGAKKDIGGGTTLGKNDLGNDECYVMIETGYTQGHWPVVLDEDGNACARFDPSATQNNGVTSGQLILNYAYRESNISAEVQFKVASGSRAGIRFGSSGPGNGFLFLADFNSKSVHLIQESNGSTQTIASASMGDRALNYGDRITMRVRVNGGVAQCLIGGLNLLGNQNITLTPGAMGFYASNCDSYLYMMSLGSTSKWETLERFSLMVDGVEHKLGEISRPGITRDEWGYLNYSGLNEYNSREVLADGSRPEISLDYVFKPVYVPTFTGKKDIKIKLIDAGLWYKMLYIGDAEGMSITYAGDEESFNRAMNIAVYQYNCKGIGLWVLGQADPRIFETLPDVVSWHP